MPKNLPENLDPCSPETLRAMKPWLEAWNRRTEVAEYVEEDPVLFMHSFEDREDRLLAGFFAALMAWGRRDVVINKVEDLMERMDYRPAGFIRGFSERDRPRLEGFKHRTFKPVDIYWLVTILQSALERHGGMEAFWRHCHELARRQERPLIALFHEEFFALRPEAAQRTRKHISNPEKNSSCKRLWLYLRWSVRGDSPVDTGLMDFISPAELMIPLDVHVARQARALGLLTRRYNDWKAVRELTGVLRELDPADPARYDYGLFGLGVSGEPIPREFLVNPNVL